MFVKLEKIKKGKNKYLNWIGAAKDILQFLSTVDSKKMTERFLDNHRAWNIPDNLFPDNVATNVVRNYYNSYPLWWIKADYLCEKFGLSMAVAHFFSFLSPAELLRMEQLPWGVLPKRERALALQAAFAAEEGELVKNLLGDSSFSEVET
jgi:hypothetical protein